MITLLIEKNGNCIRSFGIRTLSHNIYFVNVKFISRRDQNAAHKTRIKIQARISVGSDTFVTDNEDRFIGSILPFILSYKSNLKY